MTPLSPVWTVEFDRYLNWALSSGILLTTDRFPKQMTTDEVQSALFGQWYCEVRHGR